MAGIGFELQRILEEKTLTSVAKTFGYAAVLSSGPWVISMIIILAMGLTSVYLSHNMPQGVMLQSTVTYISALALSSIFTGFLQLPFTRFVADRIYEKRYYLILPNLFGLLVFVVVVGAVVVTPISFYLFPTQSNLFILLYISIFIILSLVWITNILAASLKLYKYVILFYFIGYGTIYLFSIFLREYELIGYLIAFLIGNSLLFVLLLLGIIYYYPSCNSENRRFLRFDMFRERYSKFYWKLAWAGFLGNFAIWIDKVIFWYSPDLGYSVIDNLHASMVYDFPIFLAYLTIIPGMAIFFYRLEVDFVEAYNNFYSGVSKFGTIAQIKGYKNDMILSVNRTIKEILLIQGMFNILIFLSAEQLFGFFQLSKLYIPLFYIDVIGVQLQLGFMAIMAYLYYLDRQRETLFYTIAFVVLNMLLTWITIQLGPYFYGYGFTLTLLVLFLSAVYRLNKILQELDYQIFMLQ
jgi:uncharacterized membrane protein